MRGVVLYSVPPQTHSDRSRQVPCYSQRPFVETTRFDLSSAVDRTAGLLVSAVPSSLGLATCTAGPGPPAGDREPSITSPSPDDCQKATQTEPMSVVVDWESSGFVSWRECCAMPIGHVEGGPEFRSWRCPLCQWCSYCRRLKVFSRGARVHGGQ